MIQVEKPCVKLAACRANTGMNQGDFARAIGVDVATLEAWEDNITEPDISVLLKISEISGIPLGIIYIPDNTR